MFEDGRKVADGSVVRADLCIIGGGAAGITIARALSGSSLSVVVLESGGYVGDTKTQALYDGRNIGTPMNSSHGGLELEDLRLRFLGGTTNHWAGWCRPLEPVDFTATPARPDSSWPFGRDVLDPWYEQAGRVCQIGAFEYESEYWQRKTGISAPLFDSDLVTTRMIQVAFPLPFGEQYRKDLKRARNVRVLLHSNLVNLSAAPNGQHVNAAEVATLDGHQVARRGPRVRPRDGWHRGRATAARVERRAPERAGQRQRSRRALLHGPHRRARWHRGPDAAEQGR